MRSRLPGRQRRRSKPRATEGTETAYAEDVEKLREAHQLAFADISRVRHETALAKLPAVIEHLTDCLEDSTRKLIVFAHHKDVISGIVAGVAEVLGSSRGIVTVTGETAIEARQRAVERFQTDATCRVFVGNILAAGTGLTLTASSHVIFAELDWVPGNVTQAEDRAHRIGQTDSVLIQHLVMDGSIDAKMARTLVRKQDVIDRALDQQAAPVDDGADMLETALA